MTDKYILASLDENKSKELAQIISNDTSRKIMGLLSEKDKLSPTQISEELKIPITTIIYNLKQLKKQGIIEIKGSKWSEKGRKIKFYSLVQKMIIIVPKGDGWKKTLEQIIPVALVGIIGTSLLKHYASGLFNTSYTTSMGYTQGTTVVEESVVVAGDTIIYGRPAEGFAFDISSLISPEYYWLYFLILVCLIILIMIYLDYRRSKK